MLGISRGAPLCLALIITATNPSVARPALAVAADRPIDRLFAAVAAYAPDFSDSNEIRRRCGSDVLCAAHLVAHNVGGNVERVEHPDTDAIRRVATLPSVRVLGQLTDASTLIALDRFGRTAESELRRAISASAAGGIVLDLRANRGGGFESMLRVAGLFAGPVDGAVYVIGNDGRRLRAIPAVDPVPAPRGLRVVVGPETASSGEMLAALLRRHAGAEIVGQRTRGKDYLVRVIPLNHDWRLAIPAERVEIAGEELAGGLRPDRPAPELAPR
jgi:hypothetical protein